MPILPDPTDLACAYLAKTDAVLALDSRISQLLRARDRLRASFDAVAAQVDRLLNQGQAPLILLDELERIDARAAEIERELEQNLTAAIHRFK